MANPLSLCGLLALTLSISPVAAQSSQTPATPRAQATPSHHLVKVKIRDARSLARLLALDLDLASCCNVEVGQKELDVIATDADILTLTGSGLPFTVEQRNLEAFHAKDLARFKSKHAPLTLTPAIGQGGMGGHYTLAEMEAILDSFQQNHPNLCSKKVSIGKSIEGRDLWMVKISDNVNTKENEPEVYYDALHHAREPVSMSATLLFMDELLDGYGIDPEATFIVDNRELYFIPCVNPDGYEYNRVTNPGGGGMWRKNRRNNGNGTYGVDLNRNYTTGWTAPNGGNSTDPNSQIYRGPAAFSEPETSAIEAFMAKHSFAQTFTTHTYTEILLRTWGYQSIEPANGAQYDLIGDELTRANGIAHGSIAKLLYIAAGSAVDHHHAVHGAFAWTAELGRSNEGGFWPNPTNTVLIANRHQPMFRAVALTSDAYVVIGSITLREAPGGNGNGTVDPGETGEIVVTGLNRGLAAAGSNVQLTLRSLSSHATLGVAQASLGQPAQFASSNNSSQPLTFTLAPSASSGVTKLEVDLSFQGLVETRTIQFISGLRTIMNDDMERDRGFERVANGTATTGLWERAQSQATTNGGQTYNPGTQHTPGGSLCLVTDGRAGSSVGAHDVDGGVTEIVSPVMQLAHMQYAKISFWRWYAESQDDDAFEAHISYDAGQSWIEIIKDSSSTSGWVKFEHELTKAPTDLMQLRFHAQDLNASLVEAAIDDLRIEGVTADGSITLLSSGAIGTSVRAGIAAPAGSTVWALFAPNTGSQTIPGIGGTLELDLQSVVVIPSMTVGAQGYVATDITIPQNPSLRGLTLHWQALTNTAGSWSFGNRQRLTLR